MHRRWMAFWLSLLLMTSAALAEESAAHISEVTTRMGENHVCYPQLEGMADAAVQQRINDDMVAASGVAEHMVALFTQNPWKLEVDHQSCLLGETFFSTVISARGKLPGERDGHRYTALCYDLRTGERLTLDDVFTDVEEAVCRMEEIALESLSGELNGYLECSELTPLPRDAFTLDEYGMTFWYPSDQFRLLSGYSGAIQFRYEELDGLWKITPPAAPGPETIQACVEAGELPGIPARLGQPLTELKEAYRLLREPDTFPFGRGYCLEAPCMRDVLILSDSLERNEARSVVEGIQLRRGEVCGLRVGASLREDWLAQLGGPDESLTLTEGMAYDYDLPAGGCDVYHYGTNELRLYADEAGVLSAIQLCK